MQKNSSSIIIVLLVVIAGLLLYNNCSPKINAPAEVKPSSEKAKPSVTPSSAIDERTSEAVVVKYVKQNGKLPDYYISKREAAASGWIASEGNLCEVLPGRAIGGDIFSNREGSLPVKAGRTWHEADLNYNCGRRNAHRILFSSDGLVFVTHDHYKTFEEK